MTGGQNERLWADLDDPGTSGGGSLLLPAIVLSGANLLAIVHPHPIVPAVLSAVLVLAGFVMAAVVVIRRGWARSASGDGLLLPALVLFSGFVAAILCDVDRAVATMAHIAP